jgi:hypothetical protein
MADPARKHRNARRLARKSRHGSALVELVMGMLFLMLITGLVLWVGLASIHMAEVSIETRATNWMARYEDKSVRKSQPFKFDREGEIRLTRDTRVTELGPLFDSFPGQSSTNLVNCGTWDHRQLDLSKIPNWARYRELAILAAPQKFQNLAGSFPIDFGQITSDMSAQIEKQFGDKLSGQLGDEIKKLLNIDYNGKMDEQREKGRRDEESRRRDVEAEIAKNRAKIGELSQQLSDATAQITAAQTTIRQLEEELKTASDKAPIQRRIDEQNQTIATLNGRQQSIRNQIPPIQEKLQKAEQLLVQMKSTPTGE